MRNLAGFCKVFLCFSVFFIGLISNSAWSSIPAGYNRVFPEEKRVYVTPPQIEITDYGIIAWLTDEKSFILGESLAFDSNGLYVKPMPLERGPCGLHDRWCKRCGGCGVLLCPMNCTCYD